MIHDLIEPFLEFAFMRRALVGCSRSRSARRRSACS